MKVTQGNNDFLLVDGLSKMLERANINLLTNNDPDFRAKWTFHKEVIERSLRELRFNLGM